MQLDSFKTNLIYLGISDSSLNCDIAK